MWITLAVGVFLYSLYNGVEGVDCNLINNTINWDIHCRVLWRGVTEPNSVGPSDIDHVLSACNEDQMCTDQIKYYIDNCISQENQFELQTYLTLGCAFNKQRYTCLFGYVNATAFLNELLVTEQCEADNWCTVEDQCYSTLDLATDTYGCRLEEDALAYSKINGDEQLELTTLLTLYKRCFLKPPGLCQSRVSQKNGISTLVIVCATVIPAGVIMFTAFLICCGLCVLCRRKKQGMIVAVVPQVAQMRSTDTAADFINNVDKNSLPSTLDLFGFKLLYSSN
ncbi:uncharacterized protein [Dysidea avara]|uniref:uncharacterized protein n=1 Tax=Dysidea avara TaxID=196820 RepID=UPI003331614A